MTSQEYYETIILKDPRAEALHRQSALELLEPITRKAALALIDAAIMGGIDLRILETLRSHARQLDCFNRGASKLKNVGVHGFALAFDVGIYNNGALLQKASDYACIPTLCRQVGLISGYDWGAPSVAHNWVDADHCQRIAVCDQRGLLNGTWYPPDDYSPYGAARIAPSEPENPDHWDGVPYL